MEILKIDQRIIDKISLCSREQLLQIQHDLNHWEWNELLGEKPDNFDDLPYWNYKLIDKIIRKRNRYDIINPIRRYICGMFSERELLHYHNVEVGEMTEEEFDQFWCKVELQNYCVDNHIIFKIQKKEKD